MAPIRIAVVGSRKFTNQGYMDKVLDEYLELLGPFVVITGGATGADTCAIRWANDRLPFPPVVYPAHWNNLTAADAVIKVRRGKRYDARAGFRRNQLIVDDSDMVLAFFPSKKWSPGTSDTIDKAKQAGKPVEVYDEE